MNAIFASVFFSCGSAALGTKKDKATILPLLRAGDVDASFPPLLRGEVFSDFRREDAYFSTLFDLVLTVLAIPFDNTTVAEWRHKLSPQYSRP